MYSSLAYSRCACNFNWPIRIQQVENLYCPDIISMSTGHKRHWIWSSFLIGGGIEDSQNGISITPNNRIVKSEKDETCCVSKPLIWCQKWVAHVWQLALWSLSPGRIKSVSFFRTKYAIPRQVKPRILELGKCYMWPRQLSNMAATDLTFKNFLSVFFLTFPW